MHRPLFPSRRRYMEHENLAPAYYSDFHIFLLQQADVDCIFVAYTVPEVFLQLVDSFI